MRAHMGPPMGFPAAPCAMGRDGQAERLTRWERRGSTCALRGGLRADLRQASTNTSPATKAHATTFHNSVAAKSARMSPDVQ